MAEVEKLDLGQDQLSGDNKEVVSSSLLLNKEARNKKMYTHVGMFQVRWQKMKEISIEWTPFS